MYSQSELKHIFFPDSMVFLSLMRWITKTPLICSQLGPLVKFQNPFWPTSQKVPPPLVSTLERTPTRAWCHHVPNSRFTWSQTESHFETHFPLQEPLAQGLRVRSCFLLLSARALSVTLALSLTFVLVLLSYI